MTKIKQLRDSRIELSRQKKCDWQRLQNAWEKLQLLNRINPPKIDELKAIEERIYASMCENKRLAFSARKRRNSDESKIYFSAADQCNKRLSKLVRERHTRLNELKDALAEHRAELIVFKKVKEEFNTVTIAYRKEAAIIATKAKIPTEYINYALVKETKDGILHILFGGSNGRPAGPGHGHYCVDHCGDVIFKREPTKYEE